MTHNSLISSPKRPKTGLSFIYVLAAGAVMLGLPACSTEDPGVDTGTGGTSSGGATGTGGAASGGAASGGAQNGSGGRTATGGAASGGNQATGGDSATGGETASGGGDGTGGEEGGGEFTFTSEELTEGMPFPEKHTCAGGGGTLGFGLAPSFAWSGAPEGTMSYAMVMIDKTLVDEGNMLGYHSAFWNVPTTVTSLPAEFVVADLGQGAKQIQNGYLGPCPSGEQHTYEFHMYALPEATYDITATSTMGVKAALELFEVEATEIALLTGTSNAQM